MDYQHEFDLPEGTLRFATYRNDRNVYVRWSLGDRSGEFGGLTGDGKLVLDVQEYVRTNGSSEVLEIPDEAVGVLVDELDAVRDEIDADMTDDERRAFEEDKRTILRAREILEDEGVPTVEEFDSYEFEDDGRTVRAYAEERQGVAELAVETEGVDGYSPMYNLSDGTLSLPADDWGVTREVDVPAGIAESLLDDLRSLQEQLNRRRDAYHDAVERARDEVTEG